MYGDQFGEFVCRYWGLKGYTALQRIFICYQLGWEIYTQHVENPGSEQHKDELKINGDRSLADAFLSIPPLSQT